MPDLEENDMKEDSENIDQSDDLASLWKIRNSKEFGALINIFKKKLKVARKGLDDWHKDDPQTNGFYRGQIFILKYLYLLMTVKADPSKKLPNSI
jgi:hypothetical protein